MEKYTTDAILAEMKRVALLLNKESLSVKDFAEQSNISVSAVIKRFGDWNSAVKQCGLVPTDRSSNLAQLHNHATIDDHLLLKDLLRLYFEYKREPTHALISAKGNYSTHPYIDRWGSLPAAFMAARKEFPNDFENFNPSSTNSQHAQNAIPTLSVKGQNVAQKKRTLFGQLLDFRGFRFAPVNEQGVVYLFGMISEELGYSIESIRPGFPDCEGKRLFDKKKQLWEHLQIEFEFRSSNFQEHHHNPNECDLIVCWIHDWQECPLEVLELRSTIEYLDRKVKGRPSAA